MNESVKVAMAPKTTKNKPVRRPKKKMKASGRPKKLCSWSDEQMRWAMEAVMNSELGINRSAIQYGAPKTTLKDRISGRVQHGTKPGRVAYLTRIEEEELVNFLFECSRMGYGKTKREVLQIVQDAAKKKGMTFDRLIRGKPM